MNLAVLVLLSVGEDDSEVMVAVIEMAGHMSQIFTEIVDFGSSKERVKLNPVFPA